MRTVSIKLKDMAIANIQLGFVGENNATQVIFESKEIFDENPYAVQLLVVTPPEGTSYEVTTARIGDNVIWNVSELDTAFEGAGSIQLVFTDGSQVIRTYNADTTVLESQVPSGTAPATALNWIQDAEAWAKGTRGGRAVESDDPTYQNNSKYFSQQIVDMAYDSEAYAKGTRNGEAVESDDPAYHNNSKYYAESIADAAYDSEAYAAGTRGGEAVDEDDPAYHNNAAYYNEQAALERAAAQAAAETASAAYNVNLLAANYDATKTYAVGEYVIYSGGLKRCIVPITTAEAWTSAHWADVTVGKDVSALKSAFDSVTSKTRNLWEYGDISGTRSANKAFNFESGVKYTISCKITSNYPGSSAYTRVSLTNNNVQEKVYGLITHDGARHSCTVTATEDCTKIYFYAANTSTNSDGYDVSVSEIQIEKGESATSYIAPLTAVDEIVRKDLEDFETEMEQSNKQNLAKKTLADGRSLFANIDGFNYWGGWAYSSWFTENLLQNSNLSGLAHFLSFGSGDYTRGVIGVQRNPLKLGVFAKVDGSSDLWAGTAKLTPWKKSIAFFGDSIMWGRDGDEGTVTQVERSIPVYCGMNLGCKAINKGVGSQGWIAEGGGRNALEELQAYSSLSAEDIIVLCWGVNDLHDYNVGDWSNPASDTIMYQVGLCVDYIYTVNPTATVVIVAPWNSPSYGSSPKYKYGMAKWQAMETAEKNYCDYWGIPFISQADSPFNGKNMMAFFSTVTTDRVHPTKKGYEKLGNWLAAKLSALI